LEEMLVEVDLLCVPMVDYLAMVVTQRVKVLWCSR
jgi:hypothetical protein